MLSISGCHLSMKTRRPDRSETDELHSALMNFSLVIKGYEEAVRSRNLMDKRSYDSVSTI